MNHVCFAGQLTHEPELSHRGEIAICELQISVHNRDAAPTSIVFEARREQAYLCAEHAHRGRRLAVCGRLVPAAAEGEPNRVVGWVELLGPGRGPRAEQSSLALALRR